MNARCTSICDHSRPDTADICLANFLTGSVHVAEKKSVCTALGNRCRIRLVVSPSPPNISISSASSRTKILSWSVPRTRMLTSVHTFPGVPTTSCSSILAPDSYRSSRRITLSRMPDSASMCFPIFSTSSPICFASSRVGERQSACGPGSATTALSIPSTKHAVLPVPLCDWASSSRPAQILGSEAAWILDGRTNFISCSPLSSSGGRPSFSSSKLVHVTPYSASVGDVLSSTVSVSASCSPSASGTSISVSAVASGSARASASESTAASVLAYSAVLTEAGSTMSRLSASPTSNSSERCLQSRP
mmetsp:Transcript_8891/g.26169  ORF Transcript_8891/g.26169 Transcript_8891/m.26169 type:complete len:305 (-) Transcript_8891:14-928(-)